MIYIQYEGVYTRNQCIFLEIQRAIQHEGIKTAIGAID